MNAPRFMLDTNIISDIVRNPHGAAAQQARRYQDELCTSIIVAAELRYGCAKKRSAALLGRVEAVLAEIPVLPLDIPTDAKYGDLRANLEATGRPIGGNDLLIAAHATTLKLTLVTANTGEFSRVSGLTIENWLVGEQP